MIDVSEVIEDSDLSQNFIIHRNSGSFVAGGFQETSVAIQVSGNVIVATSRDIVHVPEGDRLSGAMTFYATQAIYETRNGQVKGTSDQIEWSGNRYRIDKVFPYFNYGYWKAIGVRMEGY